MSTPEWRSVTKTNPCPACGKPDWCAWTREGWLKCERTVDAPIGFVRVSAKDGGGIFKPEDHDRRNGHAPRTRSRVTVTRASRKPARKAGFGDGDADAPETFAKAREVVEALEKRRGPRSKTWTYHNAAGEPVGLVVRWDVPADPTESKSKPDKEVQPVSRLATGWANKGMPTPRPLYGLPELLASPPESQVWVCEGEKAADAARAIGLVATTSPHGSNSVGKADWSAAAGRDVVVSVDHDGPGERYGADVVRLAMAAGAKSVRVIRLVELWADLPKGGDMADLVERTGGDADAIEKLRADVEALADRAEPESETPEGPVVLKFKPFPVDDLPRSIRDHVRQTASEMDADPVLIVAPALTVFAAAVGNAVLVMVRPGWPEPLCLWTAIVSLPGSMKSQTGTAAARPAHNAQRRADADHDRAMEEFRAKKAQHDAAKKARGNSAVQPAPEPKEPLRRQCLTQDATPESLVGVLSNNPRGVVNLWDELAGFFGGFARYSKGGSNGGEPGAAFYKSAYSGLPYTENRKGPDGKGRYVRIESALVSVSGSIQPEALKRVLLRQYLDDGLASRFLFAWPPDRPGGWVDMTPGDDAAAANYDETYRRLLGIPLDVDQRTGELRPTVVCLRPDARAVAREWVNGVRDRVREATDPAIRAAFAKLKGGMFRVALLFHLCEWAERGGAGEFGTIDADTLRRAARVTDWFADEARRVYALLGESEDDGNTRRLVDWIERGGKNREPGTVTANELAHGKREYRTDSTAAERALSELVEAGFGRWDPEVSGPKGGRSARRFRLVSTVTVTETPINTGKDVGSGDGDTGETATDTGDGWGVI